MFGKFDHTYICYQIMWNEIYSTANNIRSKIEKFQTHNLKSMSSRMNTMIKDMCGILRFISWSYSNLIITETYLVALDKSEFHYHFFFVYLCVVCYIFAYQRKGLTTLYNALQCNQIFMKFHPTCPFHVWLWCNQEYPISVKNGHKIWVRFLRVWYPLSLISIF